MLPRKYFGWCHQRALAACLDRIQQRRHCDNGLSRTDIALQQPQHARSLSSIRGGDFGDGGGLCNSVKPKGQRWR